MTMPSSGALNMGGTTSPVSVASELGLGLTSTISMNDAAVRTLAGVGGSGTSWSMSSLYGKSAGSTPQFNNANSFLTKILRFSSPSASAYIQFNTDGTIAYGASGSYYSLDATDGPTAYANPTGGSAGSGMQISVTGTYNGFDTSSFTWSLGGVSYTTLVTTPWYNLGTVRTLALNFVSGSNTGPATFGFTVNIRKTDGTGTISRAGYLENYYYDY